MKVAEIHKRFSQSKLLSNHQLRVAGVGYLIMNEINPGNIDVVKALAVHDLGNIVRINLSFSPKDLEPEGIQYWQNIQNQFIIKYGKVDHIATNLMLSEINVPKKIRKMVDSVNWEEIEESIKSDDINLKVLNYADMRVGPFGVLPVVERIDEVNKRKSSWPEYQLIRKLVVKLEEQIFTGLKLRPEDITDESVNGLIDKIKEMDIS